MKISNLHIVFSMLVLLMIGGMLLLGSRYKKEKKLSPLAVFSFAFIIAGSFSAATESLATVCSESDSFWRFAISSLN